jgi:hypothetical protein
MLTDIQLKFWDYLVMYSSILLSKCVNIKINKTVIYLLLYMGV